MKRKSLLITANVIVLSLLNNVHAQNTFPATGNVGIGTTTPANKFTVKGDGISTSSESASGLVKVGFYVNNLGGYLQTHTGHPLYFSTNNGSAQAALLTSGNFGIGTSAPAERLTVQSASNTLGFSHTDGTVKLGSQLNTTGSYIGAIFGTVSNHPLFIRTNNNAVPQITLLQNGRVGIGTTAPAKQLETTGDIRVKSLDIGTNGGSMYVGEVTAAAGISDGNTAIGRGVMADFTDPTAWRNTGVGYEVLLGHSYAADNVGIGYWTLQNGGGGNTAIGNFAASGGTITVYNSTMVGYNSGATANNQVRLGNNAVTSIGGYANWTNVSDSRIKKNIQQNVPGLSFINKLQPVTYNLNLDEAERITGLTTIKKGVKHSDDMLSILTDARTDKERIVYTGFLAQDVEKAAKELGYDFSGVDAPKNDKDLYGLRYAEFVVPLVKAVQELSKQNEEKDSQINSLQQQLNELRALITERNKMEDHPAVTNAALSQNIPNPSSGTTIISYTLPSTYTSAAILITDINGRQLKTISLRGKGFGTIKLSTDAYSNGTYQYSLLINGNPVASRQLVVAK